MTLADLRDAWSARGSSGVLAELREAVQFRLFRHGEVLVIEHDLARVVEPAPVDGVVIRTCESPAEFTALATIANRRMRDRFRRAAARGRICLVAWRGDRPVGYTWLSDRLEPDLEVFPLDLPDDALYAWDLYVDPSERGAGIGSMLTSARLAHSKALGRRIGWRAIDAENRASVGTVKNTAGEGTRIVGRLRYVKLLGWVRGRLTRAASHPSGWEALR